MAEMIWCNSCKTVVWAYDHQQVSHLADICNMFHLPCPKCAAKGHYDGWGINTWDANDAKFLEQVTKAKVTNLWSMLRARAALQEVAWEPSEDNTWARQARNE